MRLRRRPRFDTLQNEIRERRGRSWGRWIYLGLLAAFAVWIFNLFFGDLVYFQAEGLVMRDRVVLATQYAAKVDTLDVQEGSEIQQNQLLARVRSQSVEESLAKLYGGLVDGLDRMTQLKIRSRVIEATAPMTEQRWREAHDARRASDQMKNQQLLTVGRRAELVKDEIESAQGRIQAEAEAGAISENLPQLESALEADKTAVARLRETYADGLVQAPVSGVVGYLHVSKGSVVQPGEPLMEIFTGQPYVLAYVPEGALYDLKEGDKVNIGVGLSTYEGHVARLYAVAGQLPKEFQNTFQPVARARIVRIEFDSDGHYPALFTKTKLSAAGWPPAWMKRLVESYVFPATTGGASPGARPANDASHDPAQNAASNGQPGP